MSEAPSPMQFDSLSPKKKPDASPSPLTGHSAMWRTGDTMAFTAATPTDVNDNSGKVRPAAELNLMGQGLL